MGRGGAIHAEAGRVAGKSGQDSGVRTKSPNSSRISEIFI